jgi:hypothetical protein
MAVDVALRSPILRRLYADWRARRHGRFPRRADFDPADFGYILGGLSLLDVHRDPLRFRCRVHGTSLAWILGTEFSGKFLDEAPQTEYLRLVAAHLAQVVDSENPSAAWNTAGTDDYLEWESEALVLPLSRDGETLDMLITAVIHHKRAAMAALIGPRSRIIEITS